MKSFLFSLVISSLLIETTVLPHNLYVNAQILPKEQAKKYFKRKRIGRGRHEILPIELSITNADSTPWTLNRHEINLSLASRKDLEKRLILTPQKYKSRVQKLGTFFGATIGTIWVFSSIFGIPYDRAVYFFTIPISMALGGSYGALRGWLASWLFAEATMPLVAHKEKLIKKSIQKYSLKPITTIQPYTTVKKLIYVQKKQYKSQFALIFVNNNQENIINVDLNLAN